MSNLRVFKKFPNAELANGFIELLHKHDIPTLLSDNSESIDVTFSNSTIHTGVELKIKETDFEKAHKILEEQADLLIENIDPDYHLYSFTNEELYDILLKSDEWSTFDLKMSKHILNSRGENLSDSFLSALKSQRLKELEKPEKASKAYIYSGYGFALFGGLIGLFIGWYLWSTKKVLPDGRKIHVFEESDRAHGFNILIGGGILFVTYFIIRAFNS